jgi:sucrose phosphorylase
VPHEENISYFGNGRNEAQMVYNFSLPPLLFYSFVKQDVGVLANWARGLALEAETTTFFNFTASHDGVGVRPLEGILTPVEIEDLCREVKTAGGQVSTKRNADGSDSPYELNITYVDAILADPASQQADRFLASQAIQYSLPGVPATYIHSLLGSRNWLEGVRRTGRARTINRKKLDVDTLVNELEDPDSFRSRVFYPYLQMIKTRRQQPAFHPNAGFEILDCNSRVFGIKRHCQDQTLWAFTNVSAEPVHITFSDTGISGPLTDLISGECIETTSYALKPYQYVWLA